MSHKSHFRKIYDNELRNEGSFHMGLYELFLKADAKNKKKLLNAFPDFFSETDYEYFCGPSKTENND